MRMRSDFLDPNPKTVNLLEPPVQEEMQVLPKKIELVIEKSNIIYHSWKMGSTILAFTSSFKYAYFAAFIHMMNDDEISRAYTEDTIYNVLFVIDLVLQFFVERDIEQVPTKVHKQIALAYMKETFLMDFLGIIPFQMILDGKIDLKYSRLLYLIKLTRLYNGYQLLSYNVYMKEVKNLYHKKLQNIIKEGSEQAHDVIKDNTNISKIVLISYMIKISLLLITLGCISYFTGLIWFIKCDLNFSQADRDVEKDEGEQNFNHYFGLYDKTNSEIFVALIYYSFTLLSTVGFGDYHPRGNSERIIGAFLMLFGASITSYIMEGLSTLTK